MGIHIDTHNFWLHIDSLLLLKCSRSYIDNSNVDLMVITNYFIFFIKVDIGNLDANQSNYFISSFIMAEEG